jgi:nucleotide-binding universal stress UspA family protein
VRQALPFLVRAAEVEIAIVGDAGEAEALGGPELAAFLARHGVKAALWQAKAADAGEALLSRAAECDADLLVMGCYGHARLREVLLGGASRTVLRSMTLPALLAH